MRWWRRRSFTELAREAPCEPVKAPENPVEFWKWEAEIGDEA